MRQDSEIDDFLDMVYGVVVILLFIIVLIFTPGKGAEQSSDNAINQAIIILDVESWHKVDDHTIEVVGKPVTMRRAPR